MGRARINGVSTTGFGTSWDEGHTFSPVADLGVDRGNGNWDEYDALSLLADGSIAVVTTH